MNVDISLLDLVLHASPLVQLVMLLLLSLSVMSWANMVERNKLLKETQEMLKEFERRFAHATDMDKLYDYVACYRDGDKGIFAIIKSGFREYARINAIRDVDPSAQLEVVDRALKVAAQREEAMLCNRLPFLATVGSLSVYVGLFGTVWGIMTAFRALGSVQQATLAMVAPGISEALVATAMGLFAAIPAVFAYNRFSHQVDSVMASYDNLSDEFLSLVQKHIYAKANNKKA